MRSDYKSARAGDTEKKTRYAIVLANYNTTTIMWYAQEIQVRWSGSTPEVVRYI